MSYDSTNFLPFLEVLVLPVHVSSLLTREVSLAVKTSVYWPRIAESRERP